jgi:N-glycosylase/DNA lyase
MKINITKEDRQALNKVFENFGRKKTEEEIFYDLCFAIMAPQTKFANNIKVIQRLKELDFYYFGEAYEGYCGITQIEEILKPVRFYKNKTKYLLEAKKKFPEILQAISSLDTWDNKQSIHVVDVYKIREWLVDNVKGLGYKASSHFLRNLGYGDNIAIIDTHIIKFLAEELAVIFGFTYEEAMQEFRKQASKKEGYLSLEKIFQNIAKENKLSCAELDSWLWKNYSGTNWEDFKF